MEIFIIILIIIQLMLFFIYTYRIRRLSKRRSDNIVEISGQRERLENYVYDANKIMFSDLDRLFDNTKLLLHFPSNSYEATNRIPNYSFFKNLGIDVENVTIMPKTVFCLMPFHKTFSKVYESLRSASLAAGFECHRSDEIYNPGRILNQIVDKLFTSEVVIAVLDGKNPNVFYEIGIAHSIGKIVILVANYNKANDIPFDLASDRLILYENYSDLQKKILKVLNNFKHVE